LRSSGSVYRIGGHPDVVLGQLDFAGFVAAPAQRPVEQLLRVDMNLERKKKFRFFFNFKNVKI
jgi:hypothetical protein